MLHVNKQPSSLRKTASKNSTKKLQQQLSGHSQGGGSGRTEGTFLARGAAGTSRPSSRHASRAGSRVNSDDEDDSYSGRRGGAAGDGPDYWEVGYDSEREDGRGGEESVEAKILDAIEQLGEKRSSTREEALTKLVVILSQQYVAELLHSQKEDLMDLLKRSIKRGGTRECVLAANVITLVFITAGEDDEEVLTDMAPLLKYTILNHDQPEVKVAATCYISSTPQLSHLPTYDLLNYLAELVIPRYLPLSASSSTIAISPETLVAALESFGLLFAALFGKDSNSSNNDEDNDNDSSNEGETGPGSHHEKDAQQARRLFNKMIPTIHYTLLEHHSVEVRVASGEVVGLMFEILDHHERQRRLHEDDGYKEYRQQEETERSRRNRETYQDDDSDDDWGDGGDGGGGRTSTTGPFWYRDRQSLVDMLAKLATDSNRYRSRKDRCAGRSAFRDILKSVDLEGYQDGSVSGEEERPQESLKLKDYIVDFHGWVEVLQLRYLRDRLTSGLQTHLFHNPTIHSLLPSTAILYSPIDFAFSNTGTGKGHGGYGGGSRLGSRVGSRVGSRAGSRAGSRPPSSMGYNSDTGEDIAAIDQAYLLQLQQQASIRLMDRKYQNAEVARMRHVQRKKDRSHGGGGSGGGGKFYDELEY
ncbi:Interferon- developmental regulator 2 [Linnemannia gamsii]|uniref:Interferon- developmental regulator 2 n=1 Tax=Linnemannia gamsii TaxID=64522 RepID=A0ABQ7K0Z8_9FUNG|nr:Interferon- developmental regulator 2 [Linnemannia gamsii]